MFSRSRNETYPPPRFHVAFFFFLFLVFKRTTIDTWRGQAAVRQARKRASGGEKARGWKDGGGGVAGWRLIFCSLASASSSASGRPHFARAAQLRVERDHPSSCPPFRSRSTPLLFLLLLFAPRSFPISRSRLSRSPYRRSLKTLATMNGAALVETNRKIYRSDR